jgi:predicted outer membrane protein
MSWKQDVIAAAGSLLFVLPACAQTGASSGKDRTDPQTGSAARTSESDDWTRSPARRPEMVLALIHRINEHENEMARLAQERSSSDAVKEFADAIIKDHQAVDQEVQSLAKARNIDLGRAEHELRSLAERRSETLRNEMVQSREVQSPIGEYARPFSDLAPPTLHQQEMGELRKLTGLSFDRQFARDMVDDHQRAIDRLVRVRTRLDDPGVNQLIDNVLPTLRQHQSQAEALQSAVSRTSG